MVKEKQLGKNRLGKGILLSVLAGIIVFAALSFSSDIRQVGRALSEFKWGYIGIILPLAAGNYIIRFCKWEYYLRQLSIRIGLWESAGIFFSGLSMSVTPGKLGEIFKSFLLQGLNGTPVSKSVPVVFTERATDVLGLLILAMVSISAFPDVNKALMIVPAFFLAAGIILLRWKAASNLILNFCRRLPVLHKFSSGLQTSYESAYTLLGSRNLIMGSILSVASWGCECLAVYVVFKGFNMDASVALSVFVFSFSSLLGAVSFIPGGLIVTEGSFAGLLIIAGFSKALAGSATVIWRLCTLWFAMFIGILALFFFRRMQNRKVVVGQPVSSYTIKTRA
jgi:uncharacterized protein (TIRG00374 family)